MKNIIFPPVSSSPHVLPHDELGSLPCTRHPDWDQEIPEQFTFSSLQSSPNLRLNIILVSLALGRDLDRVPLGDDTDVDLEVALHPAADVVRVGEERPLVVELVVWGSQTLMWEIQSR